MRRLLTFLVAAAVALAAYPAFATINGTAHDYAGVGTYGRCQICHVPHAVPSGNKRLWRETQFGNYTTGSSWSGSTVGKLCGTCHDGGGLDSANNTNNSAGTPNQQTNYAYAESSHKRSGTVLVNDINDTPLNNAGRPYFGTGSNAVGKTMECTSCHDVHFSGTYATNSVRRPFLRTNANLNTMSKFCADCHNRYNAAVGDGNHSVNANDGTDVNWGTTTRSMHPVDIPYQNDAGNDSYGVNAGASQFKTVNAMNGVVTNYTWPVNVTKGKFQGQNAVPVTGSIAAVATGTSREVGCQTCHSIHNQFGNSTSSDSTKYWLLAINNDPNGSATAAGNALCETCHGGGYAGIAANMYVGASMTANPSWDDHPIDVEADGAPLLKNWSNTVRYERHTASGTGYTASDVWPFAVVTYANSTGVYAPFESTAGQKFPNGNYRIRIVCTSCHSAHAARPGSAGVTVGSLNRWGYGAGEVVANSWCYSCHADADMVPGNHHSTRAVGATRGATGGGNWGYSYIDCTGCHGSSGQLNLTAHMGFFAIKGSNNNRYSDLCMLCHTAAGTWAGGKTQDPVLTGAGTNNNGPNAVNRIPNGHLSDPTVFSGSRQTHYLGSIATAGSAGVNINVKRTGWNLGNVNNGRLTKGYSKYGSYSSTGKSADLNGGYLICESCHSVLYNAGDGSPTGGWKKNLLLQPYEDNKVGATDGTVDTGTNSADGTDYVQGGVGSGFCVACHHKTAANGGFDEADGPVAHNTVNTAGNVPNGIHPMTNWVINRAQDAGRTPTTLFTNGTGAGGYAYAVPTGHVTGSDAGGSYDGAETMSCDGCHRPHVAAPMGTYTPAQSPSHGSVAVILENAGPSAGDFSTLCQECHPM